MSIDQLRERQVSISLQLNEWPAALCGRCLPCVQFDNDQVGFLVYAKQVAPPRAFYPLTELLSDHHQIRIERLNLAAKEPLQVLALENVLSR